MILSLLQLACTTCNQDVQDGIFDERFFLVLAGMTAPFALTWLLTWAIARRLGGAE